MRFVCALFVFFLHIPLLNVSNTFSWFVNCIFRLAVPYFFIVSGYFCFRKKDAYINSCIRYLKLYVIWTVIYIPLIIVQLMNHQHGLLIGFISWLRHFILTGSYTHLWYLNSLIVAIFIVGSLLKRGMDIKKILSVSLILYLFGSVLRSYGHFFDGFILSTLYRTVFDTTRNGLFFGFPFVSIGALFALKPIRIGKKTSLFGLIFGLIILIFENYMVKLTGLYYGQDMMMSLIPCTVFLFYISTQISVEKGFIRLCRPMSSLIYFTHLIFIYLTNMLFESNGFINTNVPIALVMTIGFSYLIYRLSLSDGMSLLKKIY